MLAPIHYELDELDKIVLAGVESPGKCVLSGYERVENWDVKLSDGQKGATTTHKGTKPGGPFTATFYLVYDPVTGQDDFAEWDAFAALINSSTSGATPKALDIYHPDLERNGYTAVVKDTMGGFDYDQKGGASIVVKFREYFPPKKKSAANPSGSKSKSSSTAEDPNDPLVVARKELEGLLNEGKTAP